MFRSVYKDVRYIAVNDNIDTINDNNDITPFKNILNDMYAKDISRKVKSAKRLRMHKGYYISCQPPYGYKVNPNDSNQLVIDEELSYTHLLLFVKGITFNLVSIFEFDLLVLIYKLYVTILLEVNYGRIIYKCQRWISIIN